jgi:hypothetical protein
MFARDYGPGKCKYCDVDFRRPNARSNGTVCSKDGCQDKAKKERMRVTNALRPRVHRRA